MNDIDQYGPKHADQYGRRAYYHGTARQDAQEAFARMIEGDPDTDADPVIAADYVGIGWDAAANETPATATQHTPTPWEAIPAKDRDGDETISIRGDAEFIATLDTVSIDGSPYRLPANGEANAAYIVRACNAHEELVAAVREVIRGLLDEFPDLCEDEDSVQATWVDVLRNALPE